MSHFARCQASLAHNAASPWFVGRAQARNQCRKSIRIIQSKGSIQKDQSKRIHPNNDFMDAGGLEPARGLSQGPRRARLIPRSWGLTLSLQQYRSRVQEDTCWRGLVRARLRACTPTTWSMYLKTACTLSMSTVGSMGSMVWVGRCRRSPWPDFAADRLVEPSSIRPRIPSYAIHDGYPCWTLDADVQ